MSRPHHAQHPRRPYKLITTDDPDQNLGEGRRRHYRTMLAAANAFAKTPEPYKTILFADGHEVRELNEQEQQLLEYVCRMLGYDVERIG